jgi:hypothetical protein
VWADVPVGPWWSRRPPLRLPLDPRTAKLVRRHARFAPWSPVAAVITIAALLTAGYADLPRPGNEVMILVAGAVYVAAVLLRGGMPPQAPSRTGPGDLRIPRVPVDVAQEWVTLNPGVTTTDEPEPRRHSRRFYTVWSGCLLVAAAAVAVTLATDGREDFALLWMLVPVLVVTGVSTAAKTLPQARPGAGPSFPP